MDGFGQRLRQRARDLGLSDAEIARRAGLTERRYAYYVSDQNEPNLRTLLRICEALAVTPDDLLLGAEAVPVAAARDKALARLNAAVNQLDDSALDLAVCQLECLVAFSAQPKRTR